MMTRTALATVVPKKIGMNKECRIVELIAFMAETPCACSMRSSAVMMDVENAK
jgi:hypothetical protein